jgi:hypothetical protein
MAEVKGIIAVVAGNGKGFVITGVDGWFNASDASLLTGIKKGDDVVVTYELSGKIKKVSAISGGVKSAPVAQAVPEAKKETPKPSTTGFACSVCGKELKDGKFKKCYECNVASKAAPAVEEVKTDTTVGPKCIDCGIALKDDKYTKCFPCNKKNPVKKQWSGKSGGSYKDSPEKTAQIQKGNALNAAAAVLCGAQCLNGLDPEGICQVTRIVADNLLEYLKQD